MQRFRSLATTALAGSILAACGTASSDRGITEPRGASAPLLASASFSEWSDPAPLGSPVNTAAIEMGPALSKDGLTLHFASNRPGSGRIDIWIAHRASLDDDWGDPVKLGSAVNSVDYNENVPNLSRDQHWLYFTSTRPNPLCPARVPVTQCDNDLWASYREDVHDADGWQPAINLGPGVNTTANEAGPNFFENGDGPAQLFFNRVDPGVEAEIYVSEQAPDGSFGIAAKVDALNTTFTEQRSSIHHSGLEMYFFSNRPGPQCPVAPCSNDIWLSTRESVLDAWPKPVNLGSPINTAGSEVHPHIFARGPVEELYFVRFVPDQDIFVSRRTRVSKP
jgi:hypothetical protein